MGMSLTKAADYAMRSMIYVACLPDDAVALRTEVARTQAMPASFTAKILRRLVRARLLRSSRGVNGGFSLARQASEITMLEIITAIEGPMSVTACANERAGCEWADDCPAALVWPIVQKSIEETLSGITLESLVSARRQNGKISSLSVVRPETAPQMPPPEAEQTMSAVGGIK